MWRIRNFTTHRLLVVGITTVTVSLKCIWKNYWVLCWVECMFSVFSCNASSPLHVLSVYVSFLSVARHVCIYSWFLCLCLASFAQVFLQPALFISSSIPALSNIISTVSSVFRSLWIDSAQWSTCSNLHHLALCNGRWFTPNKEVL